MSMFEWIGESINPGPVGDFEGRPPEVVRHRVVSFFMGLIGWTLLGVWIYFLWRWTGIDHVRWFAAGLIATFIYLVVGYFIMPRPDFSNMGWFGGLLDNPLRYSDDLNRTLLLLRVLLLPGRLTAMALVNPFLLRHIHARAAEAAASQEIKRREEEQMQDDLERFLDRPAQTPGTR